MPTIASERLQARFRFTERVSVMARSLLCTLPRAWLYHLWRTGAVRARMPAMPCGETAPGAGQAQWAERTPATMRTIALPTAVNACTRPPKMASVVDGDLTVTKMSSATNSQIHQRYSSLIMAPPSARRARIGPAMAQYYAIVQSSK
jgi:hypothetical protein